MTGPSEILKNVIKNVITTKLVSVLQTCQWKWYSQSTPQLPPWRQKRVAEVSILERWLLDKWMYDNNCIFVLGDVYLGGILIAKCLDVQECILAPGFFSNKPWAARWCQTQNNDCHRMQEKGVLIRNFERNPKERVL